MLFIHFSASPEVLVVHFCSTLGHPEVKKLLVLMDRWKVLLPIWRVCTMIFDHFGKDLTNFTFRHPLQEM